MSALPIVAAAVVGGLIAMDRKAFLQAQLSRPIVMGPLLGWILGDPVGGLLVGAPLELVWIGAANLGAALPQHETAAAAAIVTSAVSAGARGTGVTGTLACLAFVLFSPLALAARKVERAGERRNEEALARAEGWLDAGRPERAVREHLSNFWQPFVVVGLLVGAAAVGGGPLLSWIAAAVPAKLHLGFGLGWLLFWAVGGAAAVQASRVRHAGWLSAAGAIAALAIGWFASGGRLA